MNKRVPAAVVAACAALTLTGCSVSAQPGTVGVVVDDYAIIPTPPVFLD